MHARAENRSNARLAAALVLAAAMGATAAAAEGSAPARTREAGERPAEPTGGISAARKDLETIKAAKDPAQRGNRPGSGALPMPEMGVAGTALDTRPNLPSGASAPQPVPRRGTNWLVEAMSKDSSAALAGAGERERNGRRADGRPAVGSRDGTELAEADGAEPLAAPALAATRAEERAANRERSEARAEASGEARASTGAPENPLTRFLGAWISPRDYALLRPTLEQGTEHSASGPGKGDAFAATGGVPGSAGQGTAGIFGLDAAPAPVNAAAVRVNPYLEAIPSRAEVPAVAGGVTVTPPSPVRQETPLPPPAISSPGIAPPKPRIPDFARPAPDEKYFKQLKRF